MSTHSFKRIHFFIYVRFCWWNSHKIDGLMNVLLQFVSSLWQSQCPLNSMNLFLEHGKKVTFNIPEILWKLSIFKNFTNEHCNCECILWERKRERKKDILTSSKAKIGPWDNWFTTKWDIYPFLESKNKNTIKIELNVNSSSKIKTRSTMKWLYTRPSFISIQVSRREARDQRVSMWMWPMVPM